MNKQTLIYVWVIFILFFIYPVSATSYFNFYRNDGTAGNSFYAGYYGQSNTIPNTVVENDNTFCPIHCTFHTSQDYTERNVPDSTNGFIPPLSISPSFSIPIRAQGSNTLRITVSCSDVGYGLCVFPSEESTRKDKDISLTWDYCGDGRVNGPEVCDSSSFGGKTCQSLGYAGGTISCSNNCNFITSGCYKCGDGQVNPGEQCDKGADNSKMCTPSYGSSCEWCTNLCTLVSIKGPYCGDGIKNGQENCKSCPGDSPCSVDQACNNNGECININTDENCGSIGNRCDTSKKISSTGQKICSSDNTHTTEVQTVASYKCINKICQLQQTQQNNEDNCGNNFCQEGHCGCNEGYSSCQALGKCTKNAELNNNDYCKCGFQCKSGICQSDKCIEGLVSNFNSEKTAIKPNEETSINFNVKNPFDNSISANLVVKIGSGAGTSAVMSGQDCRESQCATSLTIPAKGNADVSLMLNGKSISNIPLTATMTYNLEGKTITVTRDITIQVTECGKEDCSTSSFMSYLTNTKLSMGNTELSLFLLIAILAIICLLIASVVFISHSYFKHSHRKETEKEETEEQEETEEEAVKKKKGKKLKKKK